MFTILIAVAIVVAALLGIGLVLITQINAVLEGAVGEEE